MPNQFLIPVIIAFDFFIAATVLSLILRNAWKPLEREFPAQIPSESSYRRKFQSFAFGLANFGYSIHVVIDDQYLHLHPAWIIRRFGIKPMSIPWEEIQPISPPPRGKLVKVKVRKHTITGPKWCFELVLQSTQPKERQ